MTYLAGRLRMVRLRQMDYFVILVVIAFAFDFGNIKYAMAAAFAGSYLLLELQYGRSLCRGIGSRFLTILTGLFVLFGITVVRQLRNGFQSYAVNEVIYFLTPLCFVWVYAVEADRKNLGNVLDAIFCILAVDYLAACLPNLSISNLQAISFAGSYSAFESGKALWFLVFEWHYLSAGRKKKALLACVLCLFSFKRFCMIAAILVLLLKKWIIRDVPVHRNVFVGMTALFVLLPVATCLVLGSDFAVWFQQRFGISLSALTLSRSDRIQMALASDQIKYGLGSVTTYITEALNEMHGSNIQQRSLHNDLVRIYLECGLLGSVAFTFAFFKAAAFHTSIFYLMCNMFLQSYLNPVFGAGSAGIWSLVYLVMTYAAAEETDI